MTLGVRGILRGLVGWRITICDEREESCGENSEAEKFARYLKTIFRVVGKRLGIRNRCKIRGYEFSEMRPMNIK